MGKLAGIVCQIFLTFLIEIPKYGDYLKIFSQKWKKNVCSIFPTHFLKLLIFNKLYQKKFQEIATLSYFLPL